MARISHPLRLWVPPLALLMLFALLQWAGLTPALRFERGAILAGQWWRLFSGNLVHLGWAHFALNAAGVLALWLLFGDRLSLRLWAVAVLWCSLTVGGGLLLFSPAVGWYCGFSGTLHGLFAIGALRSRRRAERAFLGLLAAKLVWEQWHGSQSALLIGAPVVVDAHLYGFFAGGLFALLLAFFESRRLSARTVPESRP